MPTSYAIHLPSAIRPYWADEIWITWLGGQRISAVSVMHTSVAAAAAKILATCYTIGERRSS